MGTTQDDAVREHIAQHRSAFLGALGDWLRVPSVSAGPDRAPDLLRSPQWLVEEELKRTVGGAGGGLAEGAVAGGRTAAGERAAAGKHTAAAERTAAAEHDDGSRKQP